MVQHRNALSYIKETNEDCPLIFKSMSDQDDEESLFEKYSRAEPQLYQETQMNLIIFGWLASMITCTMLMVFFIGDKTKSFESSLFKISTDELTDYIYLNPKSGDYDTTIIFLDSYLGQKNRFVTAFAQGELTSNRTRIIFPQSKGV